MIEILLFRNTNRSELTDGLLIYDEDKRTTWEIYGLLAHQLDCEKGSTAEALYERVMSYQKRWPDPHLEELRPHEFFIGIAALLTEGFIRLEVQQIPGQRERGVASA